jgi:hypothetical protein
LGEWGKPEILDVEKTVNRDEKNRRGEIPLKRDAATA